MPIGQDVLFLKNFTIFFYNIIKIAKPSKRLKLKTKYKIQKKIKESKRKIKKEAKKLKALGVYKKSENHYKKNIKK